MYSMGDRRSVELNDDDQQTCLSPFEFGNTRYIARMNFLKGFSRSQVVQVSGHNITCHPLEGLMVHVAVTEPTDKVTMSETLSFTETEPDLEVCSYRCPCYNGCHQIFVEAFKLDRSANVQLCEITI